MKSNKSTFFLSLLLFFSFNSQTATAQWETLGKRIKEDLNQKAQDKIREEVNTGADKAYDKGKDEVKESVKKDKSKKKKSKKSESEEDLNAQPDSINNNSSGKPSSSSKVLNNALISHRRFDFVLGEGGIPAEDFS